MSYRIDPTRGLESELRRIGRKQLARATDDLGGEEGAGGGIHEARKRFKKLRGLYRLVRDASPGFYHRENLRMRDIARSLSGLRDATAMIETVDDLRDHLSGAAEPESLHALRDRLVGRRDGIARETGGERPRLIASAMVACEAARGEIEDLSIGGKSAGSSAAIVVRGWSKVYARGKEALASCREEKTAEAFHELRKRIKYHGMHARLLQDLWPSQMRLRRRASERIAEVLGHEHDLTLLQALLAGEPDLVRGSDHGLLMRLFADRHAELRTQAVEEAAIVFSDSPKHEGERIAFLWKHAAG